MPRQQLILTILGVVAISALAAELAGAMFFYWRTGSLVYLPRSTSTAETQSRHAVASPAAGYSQRLHPYFGFTGSYHLDLGSLRTNGMGFLQRDKRDIPFKPADRDLVVFVFGGSVASRVVTGREGGKTLAEALGQIAELEGRNIVVVNMAQGAEKQPQQLFELAYLLAAGQRIDVVVNIDGFNEFALGWQNVNAQLSPILPALQIIRPLVLELSRPAASEEYYRLAYRVLAARRQVSGHSSAAERARFGLEYGFETILAAWHGRALAALTSDYESALKAQDWDEARKLLSLDLPAVLRSEGVDAIFDIWLRSSQQMRALAAANGSKYLHVLQPNQYFSKHRFSESERKIALILPEHDDYRVGVENGYQLLERKAAVLDANGISSAIDIFDDQDRAVYRDGCCHYNAVGETIFAEAIAAKIGALISGSK
jgi:hypothetical protein